jgi:hypothetical protein
MSRRAAAGVGCPNCGLTAESPTPQPIIKPKESDMAQLNQIPPKLAHPMDEASFTIGWSKRSLYRAVKDGRVRSYFSNGRRWILREDLERLLKGEPMPPGTPPRMRVVAVSGRGC